MKLKAYSLLQKSEIQSLYPTDNSLNIETQTLLDTNIITAGTGTTGDTMTHFFGTVTTAGTPLETGVGTIGLMIGIIMIFLVGHLLDRELNRRQDLDQELMNLDQDQDNQNQD